MSTATYDVDSAISTAEEAYLSAREYIEEIDAVSMMKPDRVGVWSGKDLVVHIADWEAEGARILGDLAAGRPEVWLPEGVEANAFNEQRVKDHAGKSLDEAFVMWAESHEQLVEAYREAGIERDDILFGLTRDHYRLHYPDFRHVKPFNPLSDEERAELLATMDASHQAFIQLIESIDEKALLRPNAVGIWSGKDLIAHLGHWQQAAAELTRNLEADRPGKWPGEDGNNINEWNEARVAEMTDQDLASIRAYQQARFDELRGLMATSPFATRSAGIGGTEFHYDIHREDFESLK